MTTTNLTLKWRRRWPRKRDELKLLQLNFPLFNYHRCILTIDTNQHDQFTFDDDVQRIKSSAVTQCIYMTWCHLLSFGFSSLFLIIGKVKSTNQRSQPESINLIICLFWFHLTEAGHK